jgi:hypothetical protein
VYAGGSREIGIEKKAVESSIAVEEGVAADDVSKTTPLLERLISYMNTFERSNLAGQ